MNKIITFCLFLVLCALYTTAATLPTGFTESRIATGLDPTGITVLKDERVLVTIKSGRILLIKNDIVASTPFLTIPNVDNFNERGLLSVLEDPSFATNGFIYVFYTFKNSSQNTSNNRISRFRVVGDVVDVNSQNVLFDFDNLSSVGVHNGGGLAFGLDGKIYASIGENGNGGHAQNLNVLFGKVIRINADGSIPTDNPFYNTASGKNRAIYALGLRNPFKLKAQATTGKIFINEVGAGWIEEVNELKSAANYGWPNIEGPISNQTRPTNYADPVYSYNHNNGNCSITGGVFYNPTTVQFPPQYNNKYFFLDYCAGWIRYVDPSNNFALSNFATGVDRPLDLDINSSGSMYYLARGGLGGGSEADNTSSNEGELWKVNYTGSGDVSIGVNPSNKSVAVGASVTFVVSATGAAPLRYQWLKNGQVIPNATGQTYNIQSVLLSDNGSKYTVVVSNSNSSKTSTEATLNVFVNTAPLATIISPAIDVKYEAGTSLTFSGNATDAEDGVLPASAYSWYIYLQHDTHYHPAMDAISGIKTGTFNIPDEGETSDTVWYRIFLTVTDALGTKSTVFRDIFPKKVVVTLASTPSGLNLKLDGANITTPFTFIGVVGMKRAIEADNILKSGENLYSFTNWSNSGTAIQTILTPKQNTTYTANYSVSKSDTLLAVADAYVRGGTNSNTTFGMTDANVLLSKTDADNERTRQVFLRFDISKLSEMNSSKLRLFGKRHNLDNANVKVSAFGVPSQTWNENSITWNTKPANDVLKLSEVIVNAEPTSQGQYYDWDVSEYVKTAKANGANSVSFFITNPEVTSTYIIFNSKEAITNKPQLVVTFPSAPLSSENEIKSNEQVILYPNPFTESLVLNTKGIYSIYDISGSKVETGNCDGNCKLGNQLAVGVYLVEVENNGRTQRAKVLKK